MDKVPFYGFGNYLTDGGETLGSKIIFMEAEDMPAARVLLVKQLSMAGEIVPNSLRLFSGGTIPASWLIAAVMQSEEATWSSGTTPAVSILHKKELLN